MSGTLDASLAMPHLAALSQSSSLSVHMVRTFPPLSREQG